MKLVVAGTGYVGLVTGVCLAEVGHNVVCVDTDEKKIENLRNGVIPIYEPELDELLKKNYKKGNLNFTTNYSEAYKNADVIFIGVGTPERDDGGANLEYVFLVCNQIIENVTKDCLVVVKSTVPIGTNDRIEEFFEDNKKNNINIEVASNPEFLAQGTAVFDTLKASRIVIGTETENSKNILKNIYSKFNQPLIFTNRRSAEMIKYASNDFLALKISFVNEIANLCELVGANIEDVTKGMGYDERIGSKFLNAGIGYGGSCFPKDTKALHWLATDKGYELKTIKATIEVNELQKYKLFRKAKELIGGFKNKKVAVLGLTFKAGTDDLREAPSIPNIRRLLDEGADIIAYDPVGIENFRRIYPTELKYANNVKEALKGAEVAFIFTEWDEIKGVELREYERLMKSANIFDGRNCYKLKEVEKYNVNYYSIGRRSIENVNIRPNEIEILI